MTGDETDPIDVRELDISAPRDLAAEKKERNLENEKKLYKMLHKFKQPKKSKSMQQYFNDWHAFKQEHGW